MFLKPVLHERDAPAELPAFARVSCAVTIALAGGALIYALGLSSKAAPDLATMVTQKLPESGVSNPVTAVLLNFRSYDTLLEIAVLLIVAVAMLPAGSSNRRELPLTVDYRRGADPVLAGLLRWLLPLALLVGGYLLWTGAYAPGGAFQAGAVFAGAGVGLALSGRYRWRWQSAYAEPLISLGLLMFIAVAAATAVISGTTLEYPTAYAGVLILVVEIAATLSIAAILVMLFTGLMEADGSEGEVAPQ